MDIVERLRSVDITFWYSPAYPEEKFKPIEIGKTAHEAADEIERLRKRVELLENEMTRTVGALELWVRIGKQALGEKE